MQKKIINYSDFAKIEIRMGKVMEAMVPEGSKKLIRQRIDFGEEIGERIIFSGIKEWYTAEQMVGKILPYVVNLEAREMPFKITTDEGEEVNEKSEGMLMAIAPLGEDGAHGCVLLEPSGEVKPGDEVV